jgi:hypothetical protein
MLGIQKLDKKTSFLKRTLNKKDDKSNNETYYSGNKKITKLSIHTQNNP